MGRFFFLLIFFLCACGGEPKQHADSSVQASVRNAQPEIVPPEKLAKSNVHRVDFSALLKTPLKNLRAVPAASNEKEAGMPELMPCGQPVICQPGTDSFTLPTRREAKILPRLAGEPEISESKDMAAREHNPGSFSYFSKLQGLKQNVILCLLEDSRGNFWFGTGGGGVTRYDGKFFTHFSNKEGLCNDYISGILQDNRGNMWFSSLAGGVSMYDGKNFTRFSEEEGLFGNDITSILEDKKKNIWFGTTTGGIICYDGRSFIHYTRKNGLCNDEVNCMAEDASGNILIGTNKGLSVFDGKSFRNFSKKQGLPDEEILCITRDKKGQIWLGTSQNGIVRFADQQFARYGENQGLSSNSVNAIMEDRSGVLWIGTSGGGINSFSKNRIAKFSTPEGLSGSDVRAMIEDHAGNIWLATAGGGVNIYQGKTYKHFSTEEGLSANSVYAIMEDRDGNVWLGTKYGGAIRFDGKSYEYIATEDGLPGDDVSSILQDEKGNIWFGTDAGLAMYDGKSITTYSMGEELSNVIINCMKEDHRGNFWIGTNGSGVICFDGKKFTPYGEEQGLSNNNVQSIHEDGKGNLWFGTFGGGLTRYDGKTFAHLTSRQGLSNDFVNCIAEDYTGNLWIGTSGGGLNRFDGKSFTNFTSKDGLSNDYILSVLEDRSEKGKRLWFGSRFGLNAANTVRLNEYIAEKQAEQKKSPETEDEQLFRNFAYTDGFLGIGCNRNALLKTKLNTLWVGATDRLTAINTTTLYRDKIAPNIQLLGVELFNEKINWQSALLKKDSSFVLSNGVELKNFVLDSLSLWYGIPQGLSLSHLNNYLTFRFVGITVNQPHKVRYRYKLDGWDENWSNLTARTDAAYGNLPHGNYTFRVKAMNSEGIWSKEYTYSFEIRPPWWKTPWAYLGEIGLGIFVLFTYIQIREKSLKENQKELEKKVDQATVVIRNQKAEVEMQKDEADRQRQIAEEQKKIVEEKHREVLDSIEYAKRIQNTILPPRRIVKQYMENSFILYRPKDIVAGDFFWMINLENKNEILIAACDCTGHGVPGAMVSVICSNALNKAVKEFSLRKPSDILDKVSQLVTDGFQLNKEEDDEFIRDGMDISLCLLDYKNRKLEWAGANNPLWIVRNQDQETAIIEVKADKQGIGTAINMEPFSNHELQLEKGDCIYLFSDGYTDQFGGDSGKKLTKKRFREILIEIFPHEMGRQHEILLLKHEEWKGSNAQVDDICIIGLRV